MKEYSKDYEKKLPCSKKAVASTLLRTRPDNAKITQFLSVSTTSSSTSFLEEIQRSNRIAEQTTFLTIYEPEERDEKVEVDEQKNDKGKQKDADDGECLYFSIRSTKEICNRSNSDDKSVYFTIPSATGNDRTTHIH
uniref:Uncharacterized protein n=1 Tax=Elaeophora elaphi TaxID=1147741 RepID=A0A0R3RNU1_9BILA